MAVAISDPPAARLSTLQPLWHRTAPKSVTEKAASDDIFGAWAAWQKHLARRKTPVELPFLAGKRPPLLWAWPAAWQFDAVRLSLKSPAALAEAILNDDGVGRPELHQSLQMLGLAYALPELARQLPPDMWWRLVERLHEVACQAQHHRVDWPANPRDVVRQQLLAGEMPLALACLFPEIRALRALRKPARDVFAEALVELTDGRGLPHARLLSVFGPLFACWTRVRWLGEVLRGRPWPNKAEYQYRWLVRQALRLADEDQRFLLMDGDASPMQSTSELFATALTLAGDDGDFAAATAALPRRALPNKPNAAAKRLPDPLLNSDWSAFSVMANGWSPTDVRLAAAYADDPMRIELSVDGQRIFAGDWQCDIMCDGESVRAAGEWEQLCWEKGKRFAFLELSIPLTHNLRIERQLVLGRTDRVLYLADIVISADGSPRQLRHVLKLPLGEKVVWQPEVETRDGLLVRGKARAAVLPLALAEWRCDPRGGSLFVEDGQLTLVQEAHGRALCCPLFFDLDRKRTKKERTWRQLTVAEWMEVLPRDCAVGFRAQSGRDQWLFYRSLGPCGNRTVLGQNIAGEFVAGRFLPSGELKEWIEVEATEWNTSTMLGGGNSI